MYKEKKNHRPIKSKDHHCTGLSTKTISSSVSLPFRLLLDECPKSELDETSDPSVAVDGTSGSGSGASGGTGSLASAAVDVVVGAGGGTEVVVAVVEEEVTEACFLITLTEISSSVASIWSWTRSENEPTSSVVRPSVGIGGSTVMLNIINTTRIA